MASLTHWTRIWASCWRWWRTGKSDVLQSMWLQIVRCDWATEWCTLKCVVDIAWSTQQSGLPNLPANAGATGNTSSIPGSGRSPAGGNGNLLQQSCWRIPRTEEPGVLQSLGLQRVRHNWACMPHSRVKLRISKRWNWKGLSKLTGLRSLAGYSPWGHKVRHTRATNTHFSKLTNSNIYFTGYKSEVTELLQYPA